MFQRTAVALCLLVLFLDPVYSISKEELEDEILDPFFTSLAFPDKTKINNRLLLITGLIEEFNELAVFTESFPIVIRESQQFYRKPGHDYILWSYFAELLRDAGYVVNGPIHAIDTSLCPDTLHPNAEGNQGAHGCLEVIVEGIKTDNIYYTESSNIYDTLRKE